MDTPNPNAFPVAYSEEQDFYGGMKLNDYFAAQVMAAFCNQRPDIIEQGWIDGMVSHAYAIADAMLKRRLR